MKTLLTLILIVFALNCNSQSRDLLSLPIRDQNLKEKYVTTGMIVVNFAVVNYASYYVNDKQCLTIATTGMILTASTHFGLIYLKKKRNQKLMLRKF